ncbi:hypothetical protein M3Y98_00652800 [Aphelenchoides besseyi]|nr:hypothetical protein M3Y98_00652800 [Aphelenchoides besseyi]KAI6208696.1 hypothetical protein M3Y96_00142200 [Aphelenchoides besseyi]
MSTSAEPITNGPPQSGHGNVARLVDRLSKDISSMHVGAPKKPPKPNNNNNRTAHVRFSYVAQQDDELTMEEDDMIEVIEDVEDGWARGRLKDKVGLFPTNFVSFTTTQTTNSTSYSTPRLTSEDIRKKSREESQQSNGKTQAERTASSDSNVLPSSFKASVRKSQTLSGGVPSTSTTNSWPKSTSAKEVAKVLYEYGATQPDELDLREGDVITVLTRKCADEGWCEGELNGRRGLFPENFVKFTTVAPSSNANQNAPTPTRMATSTTGGTVAVPPPVLPAKPLKPTSIGKQPTTTSETINVTPPTTTTAVATIASPTTNTTVLTANPPTSNQHAPIESRKSMVAGLQAKLFAQGKMPPHKPTYQPPSNVFTHSSTGETNSDSNTNNGQSITPVVQMRHSVVDPTKMSNARDSDVPTSDDSDEPRQLESLTKFRPKQPGKRPPSQHVRLSRMPNGRDELPSTPPLTPPASSAPTLPIATAPPVVTESSSVVVSTGPSTTSFPASESRPSTQQISPNNREIARELTAIGVAVANKTSSSPTGTTMGQRSSRNHSAGSTNSASQSYVGPKLSDAEPAATTNETTISRSEFEEFREEILKRLARLEEHVFRNEPAEPSDQLHHL